MIHAASTLFWSDVPRGSQCTCVTEMRTSLCCSCELAVTVKVTPKKCYTWISVVTVTSRQLRKCLAEQSKSAFKCVWWLAVIGSGWIEVGTFSPQIWWKVCAFTSDSVTFVIPSICPFRTILCIFECQKMCGLRLRKPPSYEDWHRGSFFWLAVYIDSEPNQHQDAVIFVVIRWFAYSSPTLYYFTLQVCTELYCLHVYKASANLPVWYWRWVLTVNSLLS